MSEEVKLTILDGVVTDPVKKEEPVIVDNYLETLVGDGKKYATAEDLAKAYSNADTHITTLIEEKRVVEEQSKQLVAEAKTVDEIMAAINDAATPVTPKEPVTPVVPKVETVPAISQEDIAAMVNAQITKAKTDDQTERTRAEIQGKLIEEFGDKAALAKAIATYAGDDKSKLALLDQMVVTDYSNAVQLLKSTDGNVSFGQDIVSTRRVEQDIPRGLTWSKCRQIKKDNPKLYNSPDFQAEMHRAGALNSNFLNT